MTFGYIATIIIYIFYAFFQPSPNTHELRTTIATECGQIVQERIVGGNEAPTYAWPWMASIETIAGKHFCGGVLITDRHILTAAHCLTFYKYAPFLLKVSLGSSFLDLGDEYYVNSVIVHPDFRINSLFDSDIAVLTLATPAKFYEGALPICLPEHELKSDRDKLLVVLGWGHLLEGGKSVQHLREVSLQHIPDKDCQIYEELWDKDKMICVGWPGGGKDACKGDSGGPLLQEDSEGRWTVYGIVSFGLGCARENQPGVYTNVLYFTEWIRSTVT